jgi:hypothetical protein
MANSELTDCRVYTSLAEASTPWVPAKSILPTHHCGYRSTTSLKTCWPSSCRCQRNSLPCIQACSGVQDCSAWSQCSCSCKRITAGTSMWEELPRHSAPMTPFVIHANRIITAPSGAHETCAAGQPRGPFGMKPPAIAYSLLGVALAIATLVTLSQSLLFPFQTDSKVWLRSWLTFAVCFTPPCCFRSSKQHQGS